MGKLYVLWRKNKKKKMKQYTESACTIIRELWKHQVLLRSNEKKKKIEENRNG